MVAGDRRIETLIQSLTRLWAWAGVPLLNNNARGDSRVYGLWRGEGLATMIPE
jgi:hypothetical protein